jgi:hypothetical protein
LIKEKLMPTKCIIHSGLVVNSGSVALIWFRQIYRFDYFKGGKFGSLHNLNIIAFKSVTKPYISRHPLFNKTQKHRNFN